MFLVTALTHPMSESDLNNLATVRKGTPDLYLTTQNYYFPCHSWMWMQICYTNFQVYYWSGAPCLSPKHNLEHCQGWLLDITSHQASPNIQISSGLKGSQEQSFSKRTVLKYTDHQSTRLPLRQEGHFISCCTSVQQPSSQLQPL